MELQVSARERPLCSPWGRERCADALGAVGLAVFSSSLTPAKGLTADLCSVNTALQIRTLQCPTLLLHIAEMTNMCSVIRVTAFYARNNAGSSGFS